MRPTDSRIFIGLLLASLAACTSGQTGGQVGTPDQSAEGGCAVLSETRVERSEQSPLGFSPADVLAFAEGSHASPLEWARGDALASRVTVTPEAGLTELTLVVVDEGAPAEYVAQEPENSSGGEPAGGPGQPGEPGAPGEPGGGPGGSACPAFLRLPVRVEIATANGAFADTFQAALRSVSAGQTELHIEFDLPGLEGNFQVDPVDPAQQAKQFRLSASISETAFTGTVEGILEQHHDSAVSATWLEYAAWPPSGDLQR
jgi:hypothetical protein